MRENAPSATARIVAQNVLLVASTESFTKLVPYEAAEICALLVADSSARGPVFLKGARARFFQAVQRLVERVTIPGLALHQALRKRFIERVVRESLAHGFEQLVVLGGGLDSLTVRLHREFTEANFLELDHPATQRAKLRSLVSRSLIRPNLKLLPVDFTKQSLEEALAASSDYSPHRATLFLAEGVLMYLERREVERIFDVVRRQPGRKRFIFTFMERDSKGRASFRRATWIARLWLKLCGEPFKWGLERAELKSFLAERGFDLKESGTPEVFRETYLEDAGLTTALLAEGENVAVADAL